MPNFRYHIYTYIYLERKREQRYLKREDGREAEQVIHLMSSNTRNIFYRKPRGSSESAVN